MGLGEMTVRARLACCQLWSGGVDVAGPQLSKRRHEGGLLELQLHTAHARDGSRNGLTVTDVRYNIRSSTNRVPEHRMVPAEVCDGQEQARSTLDGREVDLTTRF